MDEAVATHGCCATVMVHGTAEAEAIAAKSGMSIADLLRPFRDLNADTTMQTLGEPYRMRTFHLRFVHTSEFKETAPEHAEAHLTRLLATYDCEKELNEAQKLDLVHDPVAANAASMQLPPLLSPTTSWLTAFRKHLAESLRNGEGCSLDYPVGCLLVASATQSGPVGTFNSLNAAANATRVLADGLADPLLPRSYACHPCPHLRDAKPPSVSSGLTLPGRYVLLHDASEAPDGLPAPQAAGARMLWPRASTSSTRRKAVLQARGTSSLAPSSGGRAEQRLRGN